MTETGTGLAGKSILLHVGQGKTGSSFIQSCLTISADDLAAQGIHYPSSGKERERALAGHVNVGNFPPTRGRGFHTPGSFIDRLATADWGAAPRLLLSNEGLFSSICHRDLLPEIVANSGGAKVEMLLFIRDPLEHALSAYQQGLKGGLTKTLSEFLGNYSVPNQTRKFLDLLRAEGIAVTVFNYSRHKRDITAVLARWLDLPEGTLTLPPHARVNRSLSRAEMQMQIAFNTHVGKRARLFVSDALSNELPDIASEMPYVEADALAAFLDRMRSQTGIVNQMLPEAERYSVEDDTKAAAYLAPEGAQDRFCFTAAQLDVLARNMAGWFKPEHKPKPPANPEG